MRLFLALSFVFSFAIKSFTQTTAPEQPEYGPGGLDYDYHDLDSSFYGTSLKDMFWIFEPLKPKPDSAFVIFFWHGTSVSINRLSTIYGDLLFIKHLAKKGFIVVYPVYQYADSTLTNIEEEIKLGAGLVRRALDEISDGDHVRVMHNENNKIMYGHTGISRGGGMSLNLADHYTDFDLPKPEAVCAFVPRNTLESYSNISVSTKVLIIGAEDDYWNFTYIDVWGKILHIPDTNRKYIQANTDKYGLPNLLAYHTFACSGYLLNDPGTLNTLDFYGSWKWATSLFNCASNGEECEYCLENDSIITYMGKWSDSTLVNKATIIDTIPLEVDNISNQEIRIYPNPAGDKLHIEYARIEKTITIRIINILGKTEFLEDFTNQSRIELDLTNHTPGLYFLNLNNKTYKIIIN